MDFSVVGPLTQDLVMAIVSAYVCGVQVLARDFLNAIL